MEELAAKLFDIQAVKFGSFTLKSGLVSPIYFDLRVIISYPKILERVSQLLWEKCADKSSAELLCGVPYTALPMATLISVTQGIPMLLRRKEAKDYGTKKLIEGDYRPGQGCLIVEDVVTSGTSILETAVELRKLGLDVKEAVVLLDRKQGGSENLSKHGIVMSCVFHIEEFMAMLEKLSLVTSQQVGEVLRFIQGNGEQPVLIKNPRLHARLDERKESSKHPVAAKLFQLMSAKRSNLCVAADLPSLDEVIDLAAKIGPKIVVLKTHVDILPDFTLDKMQRLKELAQSLDFLIMEDRKLADIANTAEQQLNGGLYRISEWADLVTAHPVAGPEMVSHLFGDPAVSKRANCGVVLVTEMSTRNALTTPDYSKEAFKWGLEAPDTVLGYVGQSAPEKDWAGWLQFTPGVKAGSTTDAKGQQYCTPSQAVLQRGADVIIVGRGVTHSPDASEAAETYRSEGWAALTQRIGD